MNTARSIRSLTLALSISASINSAFAETHTFTNSEGKTIKAEITQVSPGKVTLKTDNGKSYTFPINKLSDADKTYIKDWHEKNKSNANPSDFRLDIAKKSERVRQPRNKDKSSKKAESKSSKNNISYQFKLGYNKSTPVENVVVDYKIIKRTTTRGDNAADPVFKITSGTKIFFSLSSKSPQEWLSDSVTCEDITTKSKTSSSSQKEDVLGILATVSVDGKELFSECAPRGFDKKFQELEEEHPSLKNQESKEEPKKNKNKNKKKKKEEKKEEKSNAI